jgi:hypothetical protein
MDELSDKIKIAFLDVGQGDTVVVSDPATHEAIVIDCINANAVLDYLKQENIKYLKGILTGDLEPAGWKELRKVKNLKSDVLKFPHHGGAWTKEEDIDDLLNIVDPSIVVISVGSKGYNKYKHPNVEVFEALKKRPNIHLLCTQATNQCHPHVMTQQRAVRGLLTMQADKNGQKLIGSKRGCPCAGTIIFELGTSARVIQPETTFHQGTVIPKLTNHQCLLSTEPEERLLRQHSSPCL